MIKYEDECVGCPPEMGCLGSSCKYKRVPHYHCDLCEQEFKPEDLYPIDGEMFCVECCKDIISYEELLEEKYGTVEV